MPTIVVAMHGAGSAPAVAEAAFAPLGTVTSWWAAGHGHTAAGPGGDDGQRDRDALAALVEQIRPHTVAGISYGAHQVARWAASGAAAAAGVRRIVLAMPAWTGPPDTTAALTAAQADEFARDGISTALARLVQDHPGWIADALALSWPHHDVRALVPALRAIAVSSGPTLHELAAITLPTVVVALESDPFHPVQIAAEWAAAMDTAQLVTSAGTCLADLGLAARADSAQVSRSQ